MSSGSGEYLRLVCVTFLVALWLAVPFAITVAPMATQRILHQFEPLLVLCTGILERFQADLPPLGVLVLGLLAAAVVSGATRAARLIRTTRHPGSAHRPLPARLHTAAERVGLIGRIRCTPDPRAFAYTVGLIDPVVVVSRGALRRLRDDELLAVMVHEAHHVRARDPLRILVARVVARVFFAVPVVAWLVARSETLLELDADRAALLSLGDPAPLAGALLALDDPDLSGFAVAGWSLATARVDQLSGGEARGPLLQGRTVVLTAGSLVLAFVLALGQGVRSHGTATGPTDHEADVPVTESCPLPQDGLLL